MSFRVRSLFFALLLVFPLMAVSLVTVEAAEVIIQLKEFKVVAAPQAVKAGKVRFVAVNRGNEEHELVVRVKENGRYKELGEIEPFPPGVSKDMVLSLPAGTYELSCQIVEKEEGETVDHYRKGMRVEVEVN